MFSNNALATVVTIAIALLFTIACASPNKQDIIKNGISIAHPSVCLTDAECPSTRFCYFDSETKTASCIPRMADGGSCRIKKCGQNSFCDFRSDSICRPKGKLNGRCNKEQTDPCRRGLVCTPWPRGGSNGRCLRNNPGRAGAPCRDVEDCDLDGGFYCKGEEGVCTRRKSDGADCFNEINSRECQGICATGPFGLTSRQKPTGGVCAPAQPFGGLCTADSHCAGQFEKRPDGDIVFCNRPQRSKPGRCALGAKLLRRLGAHCRPGFDMCDARRGLSCRWASHLRRAVCQQRVETPDENAAQHCTRGSMLSTCPAAKQAYPTECRKTRAIPGSPYLDFGDGYTTCKRRRRVVPLGASCDIESFVCARGSTCTVIPGVQRRTPPPRARVSPEPAVFCVRLLQKGAKCGTATKFVAQCGNGLRCMNGKCATEPEYVRPEKETHANIDASCDGLPCAPGFFCNKDKVCKRPIKVAGLNALCDDGGLFAPRCKPWLVCRTNWGPTGAKRCVTPRGEGAYCETDRWCKAGLECSAVNILGTFPTITRCREKLVKKLRRGQRCDPSSETSDTRCGTAEVRNTFSSSTFQLTCLPSRFGPPRCQVASQAYDLCGAPNVQCREPGFECRRDVCVPKRN